MPIRINLLAEAKAEEEARRKDPVKRVLLVAILLVVAVVFWSLTLQAKIMIAKSELNGIEAKWKSIEKKYDEVVGQQRAFLDAQERLAALQEYTTNRFLWGTALSALPLVMTNVDDLQVLRFKVDQSYALSEDPRNRNTPAPGTPAAKDATSTERIVLTIDAQDTAVPPGAANVNSFRSAITNAPFFRTALKKTNGVQLVNMTPPRPTADGRRQVVDFTLQCSFPEKVR